MSHAGKRAGLRPDTRSGLWTHMAYVIGQLRPALVVIENVRGLLSARAAGDLEPCPWCVGDGEDGALGGRRSADSDAPAQRRWPAGRNDEEPGAKGQPRALGNGVEPQQAAEALRYLLEEMP